MPATSIRDLVIKDDDLVVGTHGRSFWILDDITPLRQLTNQLINQTTILYKPQTAYRVRWNMNTDTPLPQEEPAGQNPPDGAIINYYLKDKAGGEVMLDIIDAKGKTIRHFSSNDKPYKIPEVNIPLYWIRPQEILSAEAGSHRFLWDLHYTPLDLPPSYPIAAIYKNTAPDPTSPWVMPGTYTVKLTVDGKSYTQPLTIKMDPRVKTSTADLQKQHDLSLQSYEGRKQTTEILKEIRNLRSQLKELISASTGELQNKLKQLDAGAADLENTEPGSKEQSFSRMNGSFTSVFNTLQDGDMTPTSQLINAATAAEKTSNELLSKWMMLKNKNIPALNHQIKTAGFKMISLVMSAPKTYGLTHLALVVKDIDEMESRIIKAGGIIVDKGEFCPVNPIFFLKIQMVMKLKCGTNWNVTNKLHN